MALSQARVCAYLLGLWGLPYPIVEAVANHHAPSRVKEQKTLGALGAAHLGEYLSGHADVEGVSPQMDEEYVRGLGVLGELPKWRALAAQSTSGEGKVGRPGRDTPSGPAIPAR